MEEKKLETLYDHYKETNQLRLEAQKRRNRHFAICCVMEAASFFFVVQPGTMISAFQGFIKKKFGIEISIGNNVFQTLLWLLLTFILIRYVQETLYIERQYVYQNALEKQLDLCTSMNLFGREGEWYTKGEYPNSQNLIDLFYKVVAPLMFLTINVFKIIVEMFHINWTVFIDMILCISMIIILWAFFFDIHPKIAKCCRERIPGFAKAADWIRKQLKKV